MYKKLLTLCVIWLCCIFTISCTKKTSLSEKQSYRDTTGSIMTLANTPSAIPLGAVATPINTVSAPVKAVSVPLKAVSVPLKSVSAPLKSVPTPKTVKQTAILKEINVVYMEDSKKGWALQLNGSLITTNNAWSSYKEIHKFTVHDTDSILSIAYVNNTLYVFGFFSPASGIDVYKSKDDGSTWSKGHIKSADIKYARGGELYSSFVDNKVGYLLYCGDPAAGLMEKYLFKTMDGGKTYKEIDDVSYIQGYPTGMAFNKAGTGFITSTYHGADNSYLYSLKNTAKTWKNLIVRQPKDLTYRYIEGYPPYFIGKKGIMILKYATDNDPVYVIFQSSDSGKTWTPDGRIPLQGTLAGYSFSNKNTLYIVDDTGGMLKAVKNNGKWAVSSVTTKLSQ